MTFGTLLILVLLAFLGTGVRAIGERERLAVMRLGRFAGIRGPGLAWIAPFVERAVRVDLDREVPGWRSLSAAELARELEVRMTTSRVEG